jgi:hypothetical protein
MWWLCAGRLTAEGVPHPKERCCSLVFWRPAPGLVEALRPEGRTVYCRVNVDRHCSRGRIRSYALRIGGDTTAKPTCAGNCLSVWPAAIAGGTQIVLRGHPAYTYTKDSAAGQIIGQGVKDQWGTWYALHGGGNAISKPATAGGASSTSNKGSGGYGY